MSRYIDMQYVYLDLQHCICVYIYIYRYTQYPCVCIYIERERELRDCVVYLYSFPNLPQEYRPTCFALQLQKGSAPLVRCLSGSQGPQFPDQTSHYETADHLRDVCDVQLDQFGKMVAQLLQPSYPDEHPTAQGATIGSHGRSA